MSKIRKMVTGIALAVCVFGSSVSSCYAMTSNIEVGVTATNAWGNFRYDEAGHHLKVRLGYTEVDSTGSYISDSVSAHQFGNFISVYVSRPSPDGCQYISAYADGFVDDEWVAWSPIVNA
ncbi:MAG: hypothetical protein K2K63_15385 [Acetatifactor sp.]|nr:hypothetical protein [Acetatifactor sp.]